MRVYISGPISLGGTASQAEAERNILAFDSAEYRIRALGHEPVSPVTVAREQGKNPSAYTLAEWVACMCLDIKLLVDCDAIWLLPGWDLSRGARLEHYIASELGLEVMGLEVMGS